MIWTAGLTGNTYFKSEYTLDIGQEFMVDLVTYRVVGASEDSEWYRVVVV